VAVRIDEAGHQRAALRIDHLRTRGARRRSRRNRHDLGVADDD